MTAAESPAQVGYDLRPVTLDDAESYVRCHVQCLAETYASIMPPAFAEQHRADIGNEVRRTRAQWATWEHEDAAHRTRCWLATDLTGETVGVARSGPGPQQWEVGLGAPDSTVELALHPLYTLARTHGTGLGRSLLELAVGDANAYLWILHGNARAERFYRRNGFVPDGVELSCGPSWFYRTMSRLVRT